MIKGIGVKAASIGNVLIQVPIKYVDVFIDVLFMVLGEDIPALLSMKDMRNNGIEISLQGLYVSLGDRCQPLTMENYFLIHRWLQ